MARSKGGTEVIHLVHLAFNISRIFSRGAKAFGSTQLDDRSNFVLLLCHSSCLLFLCFQLPEWTHRGEEVLFEIFAYKMVQVGSKTKMHHWEIFFYLKHLLCVAKTNARFSIDLDCQN